jgi:hypothetical protein
MKMQLHSKAVADTIPPIPIKHDRNECDESKSAPGLGGAAGSLESDTTENEEAGQTCDKK